MSVTPRSRDWTFFAGWTLFVLALASLPYLAGWALAGGEHFTGVVVNYKDNNLYLAMIRQGLEGAWRYRLAYTSEPHAGATIYVFFLALGHLAGLLGAEPVVVFHLARVIDGGLMLAAAWWLLGRMLPERTERRMAFVFVAIAAGAGWIAALAGAPATALPDLFMPEAIPFYAALSEPHYPFALALFVVVTGLIVTPLDGWGRAPRWVALALASAALAAVKPYPFLVLGPALGLYLLVRLWRGQRVAWPVAARGALAAGAALPVLVYMAFVAREADVIREWWAADIGGAPAPPLWGYALGYLWLWPLALLAAARLRRAPTPDVDERLLLYALCWALVNVPLLYLPGVVPQRPLALGLQIPLAALAAVGLCRVILPRLAAP
jgi:hypothetical protein